MNDVKLEREVMPIETYRKGDKVTKICVENVHKVIDRICDALQKAHCNSLNILDSILKKVKNSSNEDFYIIGTGRSIPCMNDPFDEEIGNNVAFMKAKLNANIKKHNLLCRVYNEVQKLENTIDEELNKIDDYIIKDLNNLRVYNSSYLNGIEEKLGI